MKESLPTEKETLTHFIDWANKNPLIRAGILTSSRAIEDSEIDFLSDYDIELYVSDLNPFKKNDEWLNPFGLIMVRWPLKPSSTLEQNWITRLVQFNNGIRIDFQITDQKSISSQRYDDGYKVLVDKDNLTDKISKPTYSKCNIKKPSLEEYDDLVNAFWWDSIYVPKYLYRDELPFAKYMFDDILHNKLNKIIEWYIGLNNNWSVNTGISGKSFKRFLDNKLWREYELTFAGAEITENWQAFFNIIALFRKLAKIISSHLGYSYPVKVDNDVTEYCKRIKKKHKKLKS